MLAHRKIISERLDEQTLQISGVFQPPITRLDYAADFRERTFVVDGPSGVRQIERFLDAYVLPLNAVILLHDHLFRHFRPQTNRDHVVAEVELGGVVFQETQE